MKNIPLVSIVVPTYNRFSRLRRCVGEVRRNVSLAHQLIVVDGGSTDGTREWLAQESDLRVILEDRREGAVRAFNKGFRAADSDYVMWLNDDAYPLPGSVETALDMLTQTRRPPLGMTAFYHNWHQPRNQLHKVEHQGESYEMYHVRGYPYANFGLLRRDLLRTVGYFDERFYFFGADPDLSLKIQIDQDLEVLGCPDALIHHEEYHDDRKLHDLTQGERDNALLFAKWNLPAPGAYPDPTPAYSQRMSCLLHRTMV